jgi:hypothetical protein
MLLALLIAAATTGTVLAQASPAPVSAPESPATTAAAQKFYASIVAGTPDRAHISPELNALMTDDTIKALSSQLAALGAPTWTFLRWESYSGQAVAQYKLTYSSGMQLYYGFGAAPDGTVTFARFTPKDM